MKSLSLKLSDELDAKLKALAKRRGTTKSAVVKKALEAYLTGTNGSPGVSCWELGKDIWGSLEGPGDLTTNPAHMEGYGK